MKDVLILVVTLWTLSNIAHAGLRDNCQTGNADAFCKDGTEGDPQAVCETAGQKCSCAATSKVGTNNNNCVAIALNDSCSGNASCADIQNALCKGGKCTCLPGYLTGATCVKIPKSTCTGDGDCSGVSNTVCTGGKCVCAANYVLKDDKCSLKVTETACSSSAPCNMANASCDKETSKCKCDAGYSLNADTCEKSGSGVDGLSANFGMLCSMLILLNYLIKL